eukprot:6489227-Amphidinium_carterae.1
MSFDEVVMFWGSRVRQLVHWLGSFELDERERHKRLEVGPAEVLAGKNFYVWEQLLHESNWRDEHL